MYIDTHSHIYEDEFQADRAEVVERAYKAGVEKMVLPDIDSRSRPKMLDLVNTYPQKMFPLIGLHPTSVNETYREELSAAEQELGETTFYGIGECGIDLYWDKTWYKEQTKVFEYQLNWARELDLPVIIHARESLPEIFRILKKYPYAKGIFHCFSGSQKEAQLACEMGFFLGIGGIVTFKNSGLAATIAQVGLEKLVLETDAPYLAPVPYRGKRNESSYIPLIAQKIADIFGENVKKIEEITTQNAMNLFNLHSENV